MPKPVSPELLDFKAQLDHHRQSHSPRSRIPEHLWQQAVALLERHSASAICRLTHLHLEGLQKRAATLAPKPPSTPSAQTFLQLDSSTLSTPSPDDTTRATSNITVPSTNTPAYHLAVERADGCRFTLHLPTSEWPQLEAFCSLFLRS